MISNDRLDALAGDFIMNGFASVGELTEMAKELQAYRQAFSEPVAWEYVEKQQCNIGSPIHTYKLSEEKPEPHFNIFEVEALYRKPTIPE